jgi:hypothetical protein
MNRAIAGFLLTFCLLAGCSNATDEDPAPDPVPSNGSTGPVNETAPVRSPASVEVHNKTYSLQPLASPAAESITVPIGHQTVNITAEVIATAACFYTNSEPGSEFVEPGVYVTGPSGNETVLGYDTPSSCDPLGTFPRRLDLATLTLPAEPGSWSLQIRATGQNVDVRLIVRAGSPPPTYA